MKRIGTGEFQYEVVDSWPRQPKYWEFGDCTNGAVNSQGEVYITSRGAHPLTIWDTDGGFISSWGEGTFGDPHQVFVGPDDDVWITDDMEHVVTRYTPAGKPLMTLGRRGRPAAAFVRKPFNMPAGIGLGPKGEIFVADGYGNHLVHKFSPQGELLLTWGKQGVGPGEFGTVHNIAVDEESRVYICDRSNDRVQIFDGEGKFLTQWNMPGPNDISIQEDVAYITNDGQWVKLVALDGTEIGSFGGNETILKSAHGIFADAEGSIYVTEIIRNQRVSKFQRC